MMYKFEKNSLVVWIVKLVWELTVNYCIYPSFQIHPSVWVFTYVRYPSPLCYCPHLRQNLYPSGGVYKTLVIYMIKKLKTMKNIS